jgi:hypothetical protein
MLNTALLAAVATSISMAVAAAGQAGDYAALWEAATPFDRFLHNVQARETQWRSRFANAAVDADAITRTRALKERRRLLAVAEDRCSDSAWALPYIAKLAAAVPERLELRVISRRDAPGIQDRYLTPDERRATPTVVILDENNRPLGAWVERPSELQQWVIKTRPTISSTELHERMDKWYTDDAGRSTIKELVALLER